MQRRTAGRGLAAVLFTDVVGSTSIAAEMGNTRWSELVARHHRIVRRLLGRFGGHEVDTAGDGFFATFERPADALRCAVAATEAVRQLGIEIRAGVSFGELETTGRKPSGLVVNTAARVMSVAGPGEVLVPASVREIVPGAGIAFTEHGVHQLKGLEGEFRLFKVTEVDGAPAPPPLGVEEASERRREIFPTARRRTPLLAGLAAGVVALVVAGVLLLGGDTGAPPAPPGPLQHAVVRLDPETGTLDKTVRFEGPADPTAGTFIDQPIAAGEGGVWALRPPRLLQIDPIHAEIRSERTDAGGIFAGSVRTGLDAVWVQSVNTVYRIHPGTAEPMEVLRLPVTSGITIYRFALTDAVWVGVSDGTLVRFDPRSGGRDQQDTGESIDALTATRSGVWIHDVLEGEVTRLDPITLLPVAPPIEVEGTVDRMVATERAVWLLDREIGIVRRLSVQSDAVNGDARVGDRPTTMGVGLGSIWIGDGAGTLYRIDETTLAVREYPIGAEVIGVTIDASTEEVWLSLGEAVDR
jgi:class 3 adenylate cyclase/streptogramin lyase